MTKLRPYQHDLKARLYESLRTHHRTLAQLPTGGGKSVIIESIVADATQARKAVVIVAHRIELVEQLAERLARFRPCVVSRGSHPDPNATLYVAMIQTLARRDVPLANLLIIDEAHHAIAAQYTSVIDQIPKVAGFTATPERLDGRGLGDVFTDLVCGPSVTELISEGHLVNATVYANPLIGLDTIKSCAGDFNKGQLATFMEKSIVRGDLVTTYQRYCPGTKCIVYAASVELSRQYASEYNAAGIAAAHIDGETHPTDRANAIDAFRNGRLTVLTNCALITEGFDVPDCGAVQLVRPTKSLALYLQMVGRALRPADGKDNAIILDHGENVMRHGFPDDPREWELTTTKRRKRTVLIEARQIDLPSVPRNGIEHDRTVELVRVTPSDPLPPDLKDLISEVEANNYKNSRGKTDYYWAYRRWRDTIKRKPTPIELKAFAKRAGYNHQWVKHQL